MLRHRDYDLTEHKGGEFAMILTVEIALCTLLATS